MLSLKDMYFEIALLWLEMTRLDIVTINDWCLVYQFNF